MKLLSITNFLFLCGVIPNLEGSKSLPGRLDNSKIYEIEIGKAKLFFYMTPEKDRLTREFIANMNSDITFGIVNAPNYFPAPEIIPLATLYRSPINEDINGDPLYLDNKGTHLFRQYMANLTKVAEDFLQISIRHPFSGQNLVLNFDANRFHQDDVSTLYKYLETLPPTKESLYIVQDLTLMDWQMAEGTFSSTIFQDPDSNDRFIFPIFPKQIVGMFFAEPIANPGTYSSAEYPTSLPIHTIVAPMDWKSDRSPGSGKGKRSSVVVRGLSTHEEIQKLESRSQKMYFQRPKSIDSNSLIYPNAMMLKEIPSDWNMDVAIERVISFKETGGTEIFHTHPEDNREVIEKLKNLFHLSCSLDKVQVRHITKRDRGFAALSCEILDLPNDCPIICLNYSELPKGYGFYNIAQDHTQNELPWIHLYHFPPTKALSITGECFDKLSLTPIEEIIYRDPSVDIVNASAPCLREKIVTKLVIFAFPENDS